MESRTRLHLLGAGLALTAVLSTGTAASGATLMSQKDALALAFSGATPERRTAFMTDEQAAAAEKSARAKLPSRIWTYYVAGSTTAYFESHPVRTMDETVMIVIHDGKISFVEVLAFAEPPDFLASPRWLSQLFGRPLDDELALKRGPRGITGATLTAEAVVRAARRALAVHEVIHLRR